MKRHSFCSALTLGSLLILLAPALAQGRIDKHALASALNQLRQYDYGQDSKILEAVDQGVHFTHTDPVLQERLESEFIAILRSSAKRPSKEYVCRKLMHMASERAVPALATLLHDPELSHMARFALERLPYSAVDEVLLQALETTRGPQKVGVIDSLRARRVAAATSRLVDLLGHADRAIVKACIAALGEVANQEAASALKRLRTTASPELKAQVVEAELHCAERLLQRGQGKEALTIYRHYYEAATQDHVHLAGFKGLLAVQPQKAQDMLVEALASGDPVKRGFAASLVACLPADQDTRYFAEQLPSLPAPGQVALIDALAFRRDTSVRPFIRAGLKGQKTTVRQACIRTLGAMGGQADVLPLATLATSRPSPEGELALQSLMRLPGDQIDRHICSELSSVSPELRVSLIDALVLRNASSSVDAVYPFLRDESAPVRLAALETLRAFGTEAHLPDVLYVRFKATEQQEIRAAEKVLTSLCNKHGAKCTPAILAGYRQAKPDVKASLLGLFPLLASPEAIGSIRKTVDSDEQALRSAAIRSLANWPDTVALKDLLQLVKEETQLNHHVLAYRGYIRLLRSADMDEVSKTRALRGALRLTRRREEKRLVLAALGDLRSLDALKRLERLMYDAEIAEDACTTLLKICAQQARENPWDVAVALEQVLQRTSRPGTRQKAESLKDEYKLPSIDSGRPSDKGDGKRIVLVAGPMDHAGPGAHEYPKDLALLKYCLDTAANLGGYNTEIHFGKIPTEISTLQGAATLVIHSSADRTPGETHALFPNLEEDYNETNRAYYQKLDQLMQRGLGLVVLHYGIWTDKPQSREYLLDWIGGYHRKGHSRVKKLTTTVSPAQDSHPILSGVNAWTAEEEYYFRQVFQENDERLVPILKTPALDDSAQEDTVAWAVTRPGGGRGFGFTGCHYHHSLTQLEDYRRLVLNAILWTAHIEIPPSGVMSKLPEGWH